jgi:hypothetical protein
MQISGVRLTLTWPCRLCLLRVLLCGSHCYTLSPFQAHWRRCHCSHFLWPACLFTAHVGSGSSPLSFGVFLPLPVTQAFPLLVVGRVPALPPEPLRPGPACLFIVPGRIPFPPLRRPVRPTLFAMCVYCFFPRWRSVCPRGYVVLAQGCP